VETGEEYAAALLLPAASGEFLSADAAPYRGVLEVRAANNGTLTVVNTINLEDYVKGVVPNELSPYSFPFSDNTLLPSGNRFGIYLTRIDVIPEVARVMQLSFVWFPNDFVPPRVRRALFQDRI